MAQEQITGEGEPAYIVALGRDDLEDRLERAKASYTSARQPPLPRARPFIQGRASLTPLFDRVFGKHHLIKGRYEAGTVSVLHTHDADQYIIVTAGSGTVRSRSQTYDLSPGMVVWIPKGEAHIHAAGSTEALEFIFLTATGHSTDLVT